MEVDPRPPVAFISGPLEVSRSYFAKYYIPRLEQAIAAGHGFVIGPVSGIDCLAFEHLLRARPAVSRERIRLYMARFEMEARPGFVADVRAQLGDAGIVAATRADGTEARTTWERDAAMTRASDYDILRFRTERECKAIYGARWRPRVSNTERNWRRRKAEGEEKERRDLEYISHVDSWEIRLWSSRLLRRSSTTRDGRAGEEGMVRECEGQCEGHRETERLPLMLGRKAFGFGNDGRRMN